MLAAEDELHLYAYQEFPGLGRAKYYYYGTTSAGQKDVVLGEGEAIIFASPEQALDGRPYTPGTREVLERFFASDEYYSLLVNRDNRSAIEAHSKW